MYRIAVNQCLDLIRRRKFHLADSDWEDVADLLPVETEGAGDAKLLLERIMDKADPETQEIVMLLYMEGLTQEEVVAKLGISRTTVHRKVVAFKARAERFR
jgi:RNA polymerase sigma factor (sigma-70 family)